jgi:hypothetical protein
MAKNSKAAAHPMARTAPTPRITAAAVTLVTDIDRIKARLVKLAKRLDIPVPNIAADTAPSASITAAVSGASAAVTAIHELLNHVDQAV